MEKVLLFDDLDNDQPAEESMKFAIDGYNYIIDVSNANAKAFREAVEPFRQAARRLGKHKVPAAPPSTKSAQLAVGNSRKVPEEWYKSEQGEPASVTAKKKAYRARVREWARAEGGYELGTYGVIPQGVYRDYETWASDNGVASGPESVGL